MSYCLNPYCGRPQNPESSKFCSRCGFKLLLGDRYRSLSPIGSGESSRVFLAVDEYKPSRPQCVIKQFFPQNLGLQTSERARELFRREAVQLEQLGRHPQIPELLAHFEQADYQYLVQEFIDGHNLTQQLNEVGAFDEGQIWQMLNNLLPVLEFIHQRQVIHRDIKPQNIICRDSQQQQYVLVDFGAAKYTESADRVRTGVRIGSSEFASPEQAIGKATFASDLYSLGVTCIYLLTRVRPANLFNEEEGIWVWRHSLKYPVNSWLGNILDKLLQGPIKQRYQSATEVLRDLHSPLLLQALGITVPERVPAVAPVAAGPLRLETQESPSRSSIASLMTIALPNPTQTTWSLQQTLRGHLSWVRSIVFHPNGTALVSGGGDKTIKVWQLATGELQQIIPAHAGWIRSIAITPDGQLIASCSNDRTVKLWRWGTGELVHTLADHADAVRAIAFSPDGQVLASGSQDKLIRLWKVATGEPLKTLSGHRHAVTTLAFAEQQPGDRRDSLLLSGSSDKSMGVWDWNTHRLLAALKGHADAINSIALSPDVRLLASGSDDGTVRLWDLQAGRLLHTLTGHKGAVNAVGISPDGTIVASGSQDKTICLWCLKTGVLLQTLSGDANWIWSIAFSPDGQTLASGSRDGTIQLWHR